MNYNTTGTTKKWWALLALSLGVFMSLLDVTIVNVALPAMSESFHTTFSNVQWVISAYTIAYAVVILAVAKFGDMYGRKRTFLVSMVVFIFASTINGWAPNLLVLDIGRVIQAVGGAGLMSLALALVASIFTGAQRGIALGIVGSVMGLSTVSGPLIGGLLLEHFGWPAIFYVNIPIGIFAGLLVFFTVTETPKYGQGERVDYLGMVLSGAAIFSAVYGLIQKENAPQLSWTSPQVALWLIAAAVLLIAFIWLEGRIQQPMMNLALFKNKNFVGAITVAFVLGSAIYANNIYLTQLMQNFMGFSAFDTGLRQIPMTIWSLILGPVTGYLGTKFSQRKLITLSLLLGAVAFIVFANAMTTKLSYAQLVLPLILLGIANGMTGPLLNSAGLADARENEIGMISGLINVFMQLGISLGVVILGLAQTNQYRTYLENHFQSSGAGQSAIAGVRHTLIEGGAFSGQQLSLSAVFNSLPNAEQLSQVVVRAFYTSMNSLMLVSAVLIVIGAIVGYLLLKDNQTSPAKS